MESYLEPLLREAVGALPAGTQCSVLLADGGELTRSLSSDPRSADCDQVEVEEGAGPCVLSMAQLRGVLVPDIAADTRWDPWRRKALDVGFRSAMALPGYIDTGALIALNLYSEHVDPWESDVLVRADGIAQKMAATVRERR